jgi:hypothetical protein
MPHFFEKTETENCSSLSKKKGKKDVLRFRLSVGYLLVDGEGYGVAGCGCALGVGDFAGVCVGSGCGFGYWQ